MGREAARPPLWEVPWCWTKVLKYSGPSPSSAACSPGVCLSQAWGLFTASSWCELNSLSSVLKSYVENPNLPICYAKKAIEIKLMPTTGVNHTNHCMWYCNEKWGCRISYIKKEKNIIKFYICSEIVSFILLLGIFVLSKYSIMNVYYFYNKKNILYFTNLGSGWGKSRGSQS